MAAVSVRRGLQSVLRRAAVSVRRGLQSVLRMAVVSVRRGLQSVDAGLRVPGASFARASSVSTHIRDVLLVPRSYAPPATAGTPSRPRRTLTAASTRRCRFVTTTAHSH